MCHKPQSGFEPTLCKNKNSVDIFLNALCGDFEMKSVTEANKCLKKNILLGLIQPDEQVDHSIPLSKINIITSLHFKFERGISVTETNKCLKKYFVGAHTTG